MYKREFYWLKSARYAISDSRQSSEFLLIILCSLYSNKVSEAKTCTYTKYVMKLRAYIKVYKIIERYFCEIWHKLELILI